MAASRAQVVADLDRHFMALDALLEGEDWLVGDALSAADLGRAARRMLYAEEARAAFDRTRNVAGWMARVDAAAPATARA